MSDIITLGIVNVPDSSLANKFLFKRLENNGNHDMNIDGSSTNVEFTYTSPVNKDTFITQITFIIRYNDINIPDNVLRSQLSFAGMDNGLTNGILINVLDANNNVMLNLSSVMPIKRNLDFALLSSSNINIDLNNDVILINWKLTDAGSKLLLEENQTLKVTIQDNLSSLLFFNTMIQGTIFNE